MGRRLIGSLLLIWLFGVGGSAALAAPWDVEVQPLYQQVTGSTEEYSVKKGDQLSQIARQKGVRWRVLARRNNLPQKPRLRPGMTLTITNTHIIPKELDHGLVINIPELRLYRFDQGNFQRHYTLAVGRRTWQTPTGEFEIINKVRNPTWLVPPSIQREMAANGREVLTSVPPGPKNPLGSYWLATSAPGVGIHATPRPWTVGHFASHGCIRMLAEEIAELFEHVEIGTPVKIIYRPFKIAVTQDRRVYLEVHPDIYRKGLDSITGVEDLIKRHHLEDLVNWKRVYEVIRDKEGIAEDITRKDPSDTVIGQNVPSGQKKTPVSNLPES
ncbi:MAG: L,D-transpeptidase family protein [Deltaproteobacteria bacterium]|nr:L,D-transpeptidase family protein [Deltaproteobacteria bacterium]MBW1953279.1 L,D-transpeptidase family protein [Deltaproteobacteria bacterium]MBW1987440.1 L,D-transpeptidase family protein [Deltaproteobacteria bacterium]MBW2135513.1 L,D-transpeptidase family protein [Deltaproteobacteria bacterium]